MAFHIFSYFENFEQIPTHCPCFEHYMLGYSTLLIYFFPYTLEYIYIYSSNFIYRCDNDDSDKKRLSISELVYK